MLRVDIYFNKEDSVLEGEHIWLNNVIMVQTISNELVILYKVETYDYNHTEIKHIPMSNIDYYLVGKGK